MMPNCDLRDRFVDQDRFFFLHTYGCRHLNLNKFTLRYFAFTSAILIETSLCDVFVLSCLTTKLRDVQYNRGLKTVLFTFLSDPRVSQFYLYGLKN